MAFVVCKSGVGPSFLPEKVNRHRITREKVNRHRITHYSARSNELTSGDDVRHAVERNVCVAADQLEALVAGLGNQEAVERVAVVRRQRFDSQGVWDGDR